MTELTPEKLWKLAARLRQRLEPFTQLLSFGAVDVDARDSAAYLEMRVQATKKARRG
jgi:hypothetical protein